MAADAARRKQVRRELAAGDVTGLRVLAARRGGGGLRGRRPTSCGPTSGRWAPSGWSTATAPCWSCPLDGEGPPKAASKLTAEVVADPDWRLQVGVAAVVLVFLVVALLGWLIS